MTADPPESFTINGELDKLRRRLAAAEKVCYLFGINAAPDQTEQGKALGQAWSEWSKDYRHHAAEVSQAEIAQLAARRDVIQQRTLARIKAEQAAELELQRRRDLLECLYIEQGDQTAGGEG